jgi:hypothetical protein
MAAAVDCLLCVHFIHFPQRAHTVDTAKTRVVKPMQRVSQYQKYVWLIGICDNGAVRTAVVLVSDEMEGWEGGGLGQLRGAVQAFSGKDWASALVEVRNGHLSNTSPIRQQDTMSRYSASHSRSSEFEYRSEERLSSLSVLVLLSPLRQILGQLHKVGHDRFLRAFPIYHSYSSCYSVLHN